MYITIAVGAPALIMGIFDMPEQLLIGSVSVGYRIFTSSVVSAWMHLHDFTESAYGILFFVYLDECVL